MTITIIQSNLKENFEMKDITNEFISWAEQKYNVCIDPETEMTNNNRDAVYGWEPIPDDWYEEYLLSN